MDAFALTSEMDVRYLTPDEVVDVVNNLQCHCSNCDCEISQSRAKRREALGLARLCHACAASTKKYVGANVDGNLVYTNNSSQEHYIRAFHKGSHAIR